VLWCCNSSIGHTVAQPGYTFWPHRKATYSCFSVSIIRTPATFVHVYCDVPSRHLNSDVQCILLRSTIFNHCATGRKVAGSIPDCVIGISHWHSSSTRIVALGLTYPLTEMSTRKAVHGGHFDGPISRPEKSYRIWCVIVWSRNLTEEV